MGCPCAKGFTFALPFHPHDTIVISVLHTRKLWLERFSNLSQGHAAQCRKGDWNWGCLQSLGPSPRCESCKPRPCFLQFPFRTCSTMHTHCLLLCPWSSLCIVRTHRGCISGKGILADFHSPHLSFSWEKKPNKLNNSTSQQIKEFLGFWEGHLLCCVSHRFKKRMCFLL